MEKRLIRIILSSLVFLISFLIPNYLLIIKDILLIVSYLIVGYDILMKAIKNITRGKLFDENFLMALATIGAFAIREFPEAVAVMLFYQVGELFQNYAVDKSRKSISSLMDIRPDYANVYRDKEIECVDPDDVNIGEVIIVKPGEKIPLDGKVIEGNSMIDTKALTGESVPRHASIGDSVLSGCINVDGLIKIEVEKEYDESTVSKILELVENASNRKSKSENFITKFAKIYTPVVVLIAIILTFIPPIIIGFSHFSDWLYRALSFLVVSCPCALVISIPLSFFGGLGAASRMGVLVKGSNYLEKISKTGIIVCDKTGTLTKGIFEVQKIDAIGCSDKELIKLASHAECFSNHPIALSLKKAYGKEINDSIISKTREISGQGVYATVDGKKLLVGNELLMKNNKIKFKKVDEVGTIIYVAVDKKFAGSILISDEIKEDSFNAIASLKKESIDKFIMLTGDRKSIAEYVAKKLNINEYYAELLPEGKVSKVEELMQNKKENQNLMFVGDGINDAPVLAVSDIGVAMGALGSDAAIEAADIVLMTDELSKISDTIHIAKKTIRIVKENIIFAISIKIGVLILSAFGISTMWEAVFADVGVSVLAILNALRNLYIYKK